uniref:F-box domain-containing protein n=1 Tax=Leersia perrieri TaxID=77586 RepID=A0A0D9VX78_9ORYZ
MATGSKGEEEEGMEPQEEGPTLLPLPDDTVAEVLRRLPSRDLAVSRCVCTAWRDIVDGHRILLPRAPHDELTYLQNKNYDPIIRDHCNGLLLLYNGVVNPATCQWAPLPQRPSPFVGKGNNNYFCYENYLAFDPAMSPHYQVFSVPRILHKSQPGDIFFTIVTVTL